MTEAASGSGHAAPRAPALAPFTVRGFRFQWPADLATSWSFEMEVIILGWYVLAETGSVLLLTFFASLQHIGTLIAPVFGVMGDRVGHRNVLCTMRAIYCVLAATLMCLAYADMLTPARVIAIAAIMGLVRPSDVGMRAALTGDTMPGHLLMGAMSIQRTTQDSARIAGALSGAGLVALLGIGPAYTLVTALYAASVLLTYQAGPARAPHAAGPAMTGPVPSPWRDLKEGIAYVRDSPALLAVMCLAFLLNLTAFPLMNGLMPYVAREIYLADQRTLGYLMASGAAGALLGAITISRWGSNMRAGRMMVIFCAGWYAMLLAFAQTRGPGTGIPILLLAGFSFGLGQIPMSTMLLRIAGNRFRGRIMGIRMLAIYGNLPGLWIAGPMIQAYGYQFTASLYCIIGIVVTGLITLYWRRHVWHRAAPANAR